MFCIPTCAGCKAAGACPMGEAPAAPVPAPVPRRYPQAPALAPARLAAILKSLGRYIHLSCGHITTREQTERFSHWATKQHPHWCDECGKYRAEAKPKPREPLPDTPMF